jgi:hypothetical protein
MRIILLLILILSIVTIFVGCNKREVRTTLYDNGQIKEQWYEKRTEQGYILDGKYIVWYEFGKKKAEYNYSDGFLEGQRLEWDYNGRTSLVASYKRGLLDGSWIALKGNDTINNYTFLNGFPINKISFQAAYATNGILSFYWSNGTLTAEMIFSWEGHNYRCIFKDSSEIWIGYRDEVLLFTCNYSNSSIEIAYRNAYPINDIAEYPIEKLYGVLISFMTENNSCIVYHK